MDLNQGRCVVGVTIILVQIQQLKEAIAQQVMDLFRPKVGEGFRPYQHKQHQHDRPQPLGPEGLGFGHTPKQQWKTCSKANQQHKVVLHMFGSCAVLAPATVSSPQGVSKPLQQMASHVRGRCDQQWPQSPGSHGQFEPSKFFFVGEFYR